jgi:transcriptional regulator of acetoin/glycerol metabolism
MKIVDSSPQALTISHQRSKQFGVNPEYVVNDILTGGELLDRQAKLGPLLSIAEAVLKPLYTFLEQRSFMVLISDVDGYILSSWGKSPFTERAKTVQLSTGANWHERVKGTNAIGTALLEKKPVSVVGKQHYCYENHFLTCYAAPLYTSTGELIGILDISGDVRAHHPHTLGMVAAAAMACQSRLLLEEAHRELTLTLHEADAMMQTSAQPLISVDGEGKITRMNQAAAEMFNVQASQCIGQPLEMIFGKRYASDILSLTSGDMAEVRLKKRAHANESDTWIVRAVKDERKQLFSTILSRRPSPMKLSESSNGTEKADTEKQTKIIASCPKIKQVFALIQHVAQTNATVLIRGETGTGKEIAARELHRQSGRKGPFVVVNCGAIPESLIESELFGYEKGAFTGAQQKGQMGKFEAAHLGTLFLDEIGELPLASQAVLLRVLEEKRVTRIGSHESKPVDVRIVAATNRDLYKEIALKRFRADLYFRLNEMEILLPPLRERTDLDELIFHFLHEIASELGIHLLSIDPAAMHKLRQYSWPGNIRQLRHVIRQAAYQVHIVKRKNAISAEDLHLPEEKRNESDFIIFQPEEAPDSTAATATTNPTVADEETRIAHALRKAKGNISQAARLLHMGRTTLYRKLKQYPALANIRDEWNT